LRLVGVFALGFALALPVLAQNPPPPQLLKAVAKHDYDQVAKLRTQGKLLDAFTIVQGWLKENPNDARALHELGVLYAIDKQQEAAIQQFLAAVAVEPGMVEARRNAAELMRGKGRCPEAIAHYRELLMVDLGDGIALRGIAVCFEMTGQRDKAVGALTELETRFAGKEYGNWAKERKKKLEVKAEEQPAAMPKPAEPVKAADVAKVPVTTAVAPESARPAPVPVELEPQVPPAVAECDREGEALFREKRYADAAVWLGEALRQAPSADRAYKLAMAFLGTRDTLAALTTLQRALQLDPRHLASLSAWPTLAKAVRERGGGGIEVSFARAQQAPAAVIGLALAEGDLVLARLLLNASLQGPWQGAVLHTLAGEVALREGRLQEAQKAFQAAMALQPRYPPAQKGLAEVYVLTGRYTGARELVGLPTPLVQGTDPDPYADLRRMTKLRRAELEYQLRMAADPGLRPLPSLGDQVIDSAPPPPAVGAPSGAMPTEADAALASPGRVNPPPPAPKPEPVKKAKGLKK
jgi:tetratricopeptide (TPR) repeat protein